MKKSFLIAALFLGTLVAHAQTATPPANKPVEAKPTYRFDATKPMVLTVTLPAGVFNDFLSVEQSGAQLDYSKDISALQLTIMKSNKQAVIDSIGSSLQRFVTADQAKFTADTLKKFHPVKK